MWAGLSGANTWVVTLAAPAAAHGDAPRVQETAEPLPRCRVCVGQTCAPAPYPASRRPRGRGGGPSARLPLPRFKVKLVRGQREGPAVKRVVPVHGVLARHEEWCWSLECGSLHRALAASPGGLAVLPRSCVGTRLLPSAVGWRCPERPLALIDLRLPTGQGGTPGERPLTQRGLVFGCGLLSARRGTVRGADAPRVPAWAVSREGAGRACLCGPGRAARVGRRLAARRPAAGLSPRGGGC